MITEGCEVHGTVDFSVLFAGVTVEPGAVVRDSILMPGTVVKSGAVVEYAIVAENVTIGEKAVIGKRPEDVSDKDDWGIAVIGADVDIAPGAVVAPKQMIDQDVM